MKFGEFVEIVDRVENSWKRMKDVRFALNELKGWAIYKDSNEDVDIDELLELFELVSPKL